MTNLTKIEIIVSCSSTDCCGGGMLWELSLIYRCIVVIHCKSYLALMKMKSRRNVACYHTVGCVRACLYIVMFCFRWPMEICPSKNNVANTDLYRDQVDLFHHQTPSFIFVLPSFSLSSTSASPCTSSRAGALVDRPPSEHSPRRRCGVGPSPGEHRAKRGRSQTVILELKIFQSSK